jgi:hypothetical protein
MAKDYHSKRLYREYEYPFPESEKAERFVLKESVGLDTPNWADDQREHLRWDSHASLVPTRYPSFLGVKTIGSFPIQFLKTRHMTLKRLQMVNRSSDVRLCLVCVSSA